MVHSEGCRTGQGVCRVQHSTPPAVDTNTHTSAKTKGRFGSTPRGAAQPEEKTSPKFNPRHLPSIPLEGEVSKKLFFTKSGSLIPKNALPRRNSDLLFKTFRKMFFSPTNPYFWHGGLVSLILFTVAKGYRARRGMIQKKRRPKHGHPW